MLPITNISKVTHVKSSNCGTVNASRLLLDSDVGSESEFAVNVMSLLSVLCTSEPVKIMGILSHGIFL